MGCKCDCKQFCNNLWSRIIYTIVVAGVFVIGMCFFLDGMSVTCAFKLSNTEKISLPLATITKAQVEQKGTVYKINYNSDSVTIFEMIGGKKCAGINTNKTYSYPAIFPSFYQFDKGHTSRTFLRQYDVDCYVFDNEEQFKMIEHADYQCYAIQWSLVAFAILILIFLLCLWMCCDGWCKCSCCKVFKCCCKN